MQRGRAKTAQQQGQELLLSLYSLLRNAGIHAIHNRAMDVPAGQLRQALVPYLSRASSTVTAVAIDGQFYLNDSKISVPRTQYFLTRDLQALFDEKEVGGISFVELPSVEVLKRFAHLFHHSESNEVGKRSGVVEALEKAGITDIQVAPPMRLRLDGEERRRGEALPAEVDATLAYAKALAVVQQEDEQPSSRGLGGTHVRRVIQALVDGLEETPDYLYGLTQWFKDEATAAHVATNVGIIAMGLGVTLRLPRSLVSDMGLASFATVGFQSQTEPFNPLVMLKQLNMHRTWSASLVRRVMSIVHQPEADNAANRGFRYPLARIFRAAHDFIALTHGFAPLGVAANRPITALEALLGMTSNPDRYDPFILHQLVDAIGLFPLGSLLVLKEHGEAFVIGRLRADVPLVRVRQSRGELGAPFVVGNHSNDVIGIQHSIDPAERAAAVLGPNVREIVSRMSDNLSNRDQIASVAVRRLGRGT